MEIVVHRPEKPEEMRELQTRAAAVYARLVFLYLARLPCPLEQKLLLLDRLEYALKEKKQNQTEPADDD